MPLKSPAEVDAAVSRRFLKLLPERMLSRAFGSEIDKDPTEIPFVSLTLGHVSSAEAAQGLPELFASTKRWKQVLEGRKGWRLRMTPLRIRSLRAEIEIPKRIDIEDEEALLGAISPGGWTSSEWHAAIERLRAAASRMKPCEPRVAGRDHLLELLLDMKRTGLLRKSRVTDHDFARHLALLEWLDAHPGSGCFAREIPVEGIDSKWFERHRHSLAVLWNALHGSQLKVEGFASAVGLREPPNYVRVRHAQDWFASPNIGAAEEKQAIMVPIEALAKRPCTSSVVLIIENEQTGLSLTAPNEVPILIGMGYGVAALARVTWLREKRVLYFGDLDTHGLAILAECRRILPQTESLLMHTEVYEAFKKLSVSEPRPVSIVPKELTPAEAKLFTELLTQGGRLEQERIPLPYVDEAIRKRLVEERR